MNTFSIIVPTLNEAKNICPLLQRISVMTKVFNYRPEILFVDDGSMDQTRENILSYTGELDIRLLQRKGCSGLVGAVVHGANHAKYNHIVVMDADLSHQPESIPELLNPLMTGEYDMVIGSRYIQGGSTEGWPLFRKAGSRLATLPAHFITGAEDPLSGFFSIKRNILTKIDSNLIGFKIVFEILRLFGDQMRVKEVPIRFSDRLEGKSKMNGAVTAQYLGQLAQSFGIQAKLADFSMSVLVGTIAAIFDSALFILLADGSADQTTSHIASFIITCHLLYLLGLKDIFQTALPKSSRPFLTTYHHLLLIFLPVLFIRGGALAVLSHHGLSPEATAVLLSIFTLLAWMIFIITLPHAVTRRPLPRGAITVVLIGYCLLLRTMYLGNTELIQEEAYYWNYAQHLAAGYLDHPPLVALLIWVGTSLFGDTEMGIRLGAYLCWFITAYFCYGLTKRMYDGRTAIYSVLLIAILPIFFGTALVMTPDAPLLACWSATLYFLYRALVDKHRMSWLWAGIAFGLGLTSKYTIVLLGPAIVLFILFDRSSRRQMRTPLPYLGALLAIAFFSPVIWWNIEHHWASFVFQSHDRLTDVSMFTTPRLLASLFLLLTPVGVVTTVLALFPLRLYRSAGRWADLTFSRSYVFTFLMILCPFLVFFFFSLTKEVKLHWTGPIWLAAVPFMAHTLSVAFQISQKSTQKIQFLAAAWSKTLITLIFIYGILLHYLSIGLPGIPYLKNNILLGWDELAEKLTQISEDVASETGEKPIMVGMDKYRIASGIAFYKKKEDETTGGDAPPLITGRHLFGLNSLMFSYWHPSILFSNRDLLVVAHSPEWLRPGFFQGRAEEVGEIKKLIVAKQEKNVATYYYRILKGYHPYSTAEVAMGDPRQM